MFRRGIDPYYCYSWGIEPAYAYDPSTLSDLQYGVNEDLLREICWLFDDYGEVAFGSRYPAPCGIWRSERNLLQDRESPRFANRVHVFQKALDEKGQPNCGRYLGYVSLRPKTIQCQEHHENGGFPYLLVANISPPYHMLRPRYHVITAPGGPPDRVLPFRCAPFCVPSDHENMRASCLLVAVHQALLLKSLAFGLEPITSQDMFAVLLQERYTGANLAELKTGATLADARLIVEKAGGGGILETFSEYSYPDHAKPQAYAKLEALRCLTDYLACGLPVVLQMHRDEYPHAVLVLGMHLLRDPEEAQDQDMASLIESDSGVDYAELPGRLVLHDLYEGPFCEMPTAAVLREYYEVHGKEGEPSCGGISYLVVGPRSMRIGIREVREITKSLVLARDPEFLDAYFRELGSTEKGEAVDPDDFRYLTRLQKTWQVVQRYRSLLADPEGLGPFLGSAVDESYWWCTEVRLRRHSQGQSAGALGTCVPAVVCIWPTHASPNSAPQILLRHSPGGRLVVEGGSLGEPPRRPPPGRLETAPSQEGGVTPEIALITSWLSLPERTGQSPGLPGVEAALKAGIRVLDLNFLAHEEIAWYAESTEDPSAAPSEPHAFAASLSLKALEKIEKRLRESLTKWFGGALVGRRPRFVAMATFFPDASLPEWEDEGGRLRGQAVAALRHTVFLAHALGCKCVEIVGGSGVPNPDSNHIVDATEYRVERFRALADTIFQVYNLEDESNPLCTLPNSERLPYLCAELEPGAFLLNSLTAFKELREIVKGNFGDGCLATQKLRLNIDVAHAFIIGYTPEQLKLEGLEEAVGHIHVSDHGAHCERGGMHAQDLPPNTYHSYEDYEPWLQLALRRMKNLENYSGVVSVELEAMNDTAAVLASLDTTRRWLTGLSASSNDRGGQGLFVEGALLVLDIGHSTEVIFADQDLTKNCQRLERVLEKLSWNILKQGGSVMSFTGDGLIALFEGGQFHAPRDAASSALSAAKASIQTLLDESKQVHGSGTKQLTVRAALHWGYAFIPAVGALQDEIIGESVICTTRFCDWLSRISEEAVPEHSRGAVLGATQPFVQQLGTRDWTRWGSSNFKGLKKPVDLYYPKQSPFISPFCFQD